MDIHPIRDDADHAAALREIERLWDAAPGTKAAERLEVLSILVEAFERANHPILPPDPIEAIRFRMEQLGWSQQQLAELLGHRSRASEVLNHKRPLTLAMIRRIHEVLGIPAEILIGETPSRTPANRRRSVPVRKRTTKSRAVARAGASGTRASR